MEELILLQKKIKTLIKSFSALQAEQERLLKKNLKQEKYIEDQKQKIELLEKAVQLNAITQASSETGAEQKEQLKEQLDQVLLELEKNIALLK